ncbi:hypothetical protein FJ661_04150 [Pseudarthrobacter phenanthrenivorans]|uniref:DUF8129 domain-containing protein n=1 Tax=Pseudarthrobacter phenanthrenivorans (strain DSM 18606 / JCM 16027 / LMG 23796 / Sphe3) TaxID=930171 RepID=F0M239_PSEPM|nr:hypothetical protein [Pseudarthrobacter phenanthrenivorans]ADX74242.1 hypothetical protein Asphe3_31330 [Pseudarthrobacter phenanthrenivorans Sphe3]TPV52504.1 hypothetical protein FJ661_04150 [Pseudarthrobacter phenanthrenivorans]
MSEAPLHKDLPLPDYDHLPVGTLPSRISGLEEADVAQLITYEKAHGNRLPILQILEKRLHDLQGGAVPSGPQAPSTPEVNTGRPAAQQPASVPGPPVNPPSQGVPTNPAQPR